MLRKYHLPNQQLPTQANLARFLQLRGWQSSDSAADSSFSEDWLHFSPLVSETLEYKHALAAFLNGNGLAQLMPETFFIDDYHWSSVLASVNTLHPDPKPWILKPSMLNNGQHIHLFPNLEQVAAHFLSPKRMGGPQVLQRYIDNPLLIMGPAAGHKFSIRQFLVLSTHAGCALYPKGYLNIALKPYPTEHLHPLTAHLTNEHLEDQRLNVIQRISDEIELFHPYKPAIISLCRQLVKALKKQFSDHWEDSEPRMACFGLDFMVDRQKKIWLIEANHGPCFPTEDSHPLFQSLYTPFWLNLIRHFIEGEESSFISLD